MPRFHLTPEELFLWECACHWRHPARIARPRPELDWERVLAIAGANKMDTLLHSVLSKAGMMEALPKPLQDKLTRNAEKMAARAEAYAVPLVDYLTRAAAENVPTVVLKGLSIGHNFYQDPAMRPGGDIDLLVRKKDLHRSLAILDAMGNYRWHKLLDDRYYERHHLHQIRGRLDTRIWFEVHWALDHPYTMLTIDYEDLLGRTVQGSLLNQRVYDLDPPGQLLSQVVHLVKHAIYLPATVERGDTPRIVLADGMLLYYLDVAETLRHYGDDLDWQETIRLARNWGAAEMLGSVLRVCSTYLNAPVPEAVLAGLSVGNQGRISRYAMNRLADFEVDRHLGQKPSRFWAFMVGYQESLVLRPIRLLDAFTYLLPPADFLNRKYGRSTAAVRLQHTIRAAGKFLRNLVDSLYFTWDYHRRLKKEDIAHGFFEPEQI